MNSCVKIVHALVVYNKHISAALINDAFKNKHFVKMCQPFENLVRNGWLPGKETINC